MLIAAGTGALLMLLLAMTVRSGVRTVKRKVQRLTVDLAQRISVIEATICVAG